MNDILLLATVIVFVSSKDSKLLVVKEKREDSRIWYNLPGGTLEKFEMAEECVRREVLEETGYQANKIKFVGNVQNIWKDGYSSMKLVYKAVTTDAEQIDQHLDGTEEIESVEWLTIDEAKNKTDMFWKETSYIVKHYFASSEFNNLVIKH